MSEQGTDLLVAAFEALLNDEKFIQAVENRAGRPVIMMSSSGVKGLDLTALLAGLGKLSPLITKFLPLLPLILQIFTPGGFTPALLAPLIVALLQALGVTPGQMQAAIEQMQASSQ